MSLKIKNLHLPTVCVDGFFADPDAVRNYALMCDYEKAKDGRWPGKRTDYLHNIAPGLFNEFCSKLFSLFFNFEKERVDWQVQANFQIVEPFDNDPKNIKNLGWVHYDDCLYSGVVYLTPEIESNTGTSIFKQIAQEMYRGDVKRKYYTEGSDSNNTYNDAVIANNNAYEETVRFNNAYNRLIGMEGHMAHGVNTYYTSSKPRLTLVYFVHKLNCDVYPLQRHR